MNYLQFVTWLKNVYKYKRFWKFLPNLQKTRLKFIFPDELSQTKFLDISVYFLGTP